MAQLIEQTLLNGRINMEAGKVNLGCAGITFSQLNVDSGSAVDAQELIFQPFLLKQALKSHLVVIAEKAGDCNVGTQIGQNTGDIDPFARTVTAEIINQIQLTRV